MAEKNIFNPEEQFVGAYISRPLAERLALTSIFEESTRTEIIQGALAAYLEREPDNDSMIESIAHKVCDCWSPESGTFEDFKQQVESGLQKKRISGSLSKRIMQEVDRAHAPNKVKRTN